MLQCERRMFKPQRTHALLSGHAFWVRGGALQEASTLGSLPAFVHAQPDVCLWLIDAQPDVCLWQNIDGPVRNQVPFCMLLYSRSR